jgi:SAM-dependent methyltransferase
MTSGLDTAHEYWDQWWHEARTRSRWSDPDETVLGLIPALRRRGATRVLDVGTGIGRHALAYARSGFDVVAADASATGLAELTSSAAAENLRIRVENGTFTDLPAADASCDHVLAWNVLYHGDGDVVSRAFGECRRVLSDDGTFQVTMLSKRNRSFGVGEEIRPDTYVDKTSKGDKDHPHFYVDAAGLTRMLADAGFAVWSMTDVDQDPPGAFHWTVLAEVSR